VGTDVLLVVGLGNPGPRYARQRHNIGFMAVDEIRRRYRFAAPRRRFEALLAEGTVGGEKVHALEPQTFMNESGRSVGAAMRYFRLRPADVLVFHDEVDLAPGKVRVKTGGGTAGHNGLRSIDAHIGPDFRRVRLGIGKPADTHRVPGWVLSDFNKADGAWLGKTLEAVAECFPLLVAGDGSGFMSRVALLTQPPRPKPTPPEPAKETEC